MTGVRCGLAGCREQLPGPIRPLAHRRLHPVPLRGRDEQRRAVRAAEHAGKAPSADDPSLGHLLLERFITARRAPIAARLRRARRDGQLPDDLDVDAVLEVIFGVLFHRLLLPSSPLDAAYADFVVDTVLAGTAAARPN